MFLGDKNSWKLEFFERSFVGVGCILKCYYSFFFRCMFICDSDLAGIRHCSRLTELKLNCCVALSDRTLKAVNETSNLKECTRHYVFLHLFTIQSDFVYVYVATKPKACCDIFRSRLRVRSYNCSLSVSVRISLMTAWWPLLRIVLNYDILLANRIPGYVCTYCVRFLSVLICAFVRRRVADP